MSYFTADYQNNTGGNGNNNSSFSYNDGNTNSMNSMGSREQFEQYENNRQAYAKLDESTALLSQTLAVGRENEEIGSDALNTLYKNRDQLYDMEDDVSAVHSEMGVMRRRLCMIGLNMVCNKIILVLIIILEILMIIVVVYVKWAPNAIAPWRKYV